MPVVPATPEAIRQAAQALARGEIVAFPTETVYGLGGNALDARAIARVFAAKERPCFNPLIVHVPGIEAAERYAVMNDVSWRLAEAFWPGPLSLVLNKRPACGIADLVSAGLDTIALRSPAHPVAQALLAVSALPIAAPSANRSGRVSPTTAAHVAAELGERPAMILDGGPCKLGIEFDGGERDRRRARSAPAGCPAPRGDRARPGRATCGGQGEPSGRVARAARNPLRAAHETQALRDACQRQRGAASLRA